MSPGAITSGLAIDDLQVTRGRRAVVTDFSGRFEPGSLIAVIGPNGAGKSTLLGGIAGILPARGRVTWDGRPLRREELAFLPQAAPLCGTLSVLEVVLLGRLERLGWHVAEVDLEAAGAALEAFDLSGLAARAIGTLSGGQQQLVLLAQQMARRPRLLILDEPTSALDLSRQLVVLDYLADFVRRAGGVAIVALHDLALAARYADRLVLLDEGRVLAAGDASAVLRADTIQTAYDVDAEITTTSAGHILVVPIRPRTEAT